MQEFINIPLYDDDLIKLAFRFLHNIIFLTLVFRFAWYPYHKDREFAFAAIMLNVVVFFICFTMKKLELSIGMGLGLFAIFGVLRYRTETIRTKDLTYLFIVVGIAIINSLSNKKTSYAELLAVNSIILFSAIIGELLIRKSVTKITTTKKPQRQRKQTVLYNKLELLAPERKQDLLTDLRQTTHLPVTHTSISHIDLPNQQATLTIWLEPDINPS
ncbi:MAG: DUF4956 domain-containing protein [Akkermansiaceae bacterium]